MNQSWQDVLGADPTSWLLASDEPWTRYRTLRDLLELPEDDAAVQSARATMLADPQVQALAAATAAWGNRPLKRHNDASHPIYKFSTLSDFGVQASDAAQLEGLGAGLDAVLAHQSPEGAFETVLNISPRFGGTGKDSWAWLLCDAPTLVYALLAMGLGDDPRVNRAVTQLIETVDENGWRCRGGAEVGSFRGPGRKDDPCPIANVYALKAVALVPEWRDCPASRAGAEMLLQHWECQTERKIYLFGIGSDYRKLKYPFVWYDILHTVDVLSQFPFVHGDGRFLEMVEAIRSQANGEGRFTASSMYRAWGRQSGTGWPAWSFADKKTPSPWLTFLCCRILKRIHG
jgi:hypothetical protein